MTLITIEEGDIVEYHGTGVPAFARLYANRQFTTDDGVVVAAGSVRRPAFYQQFVASLVGSWIHIAEGDAYATTNSNRPMATYTFVVYDANGKVIVTPYSQLRIPDENPITTWKVLEVFSAAVPMRYAPTYLSSEAILEILQEFGYGSGSGLQFKDEGSVIGGYDQVTNLNFTGPGVTATRLDNEITVNVPNTGGGGGGGGDYDFGDVGDLDLWVLNPDHWLGTNAQSPVTISNYSNTGPHYAPAAGTFVTLELSAELTRTQPTNGLNIGIFNYLNVAGDFTGGGMYGSYNVLRHEYNENNTTFTVTGELYYLLIDSTCQSVIGAEYRIIRGNTNYSPIIKGVLVTATVAYTDTDVLTGFEATLSSASMGSTHHLARGFHCKYTLNQQGTNPQIWSDLRGLSLDGWSVSSYVDVANAYGIYADASIDSLFADNSYFIYSLATSPSLFSGPISVPSDPWGIAWEDNQEVATKGDVFAKIQTLSGAASGTFMIDDGNAVSGGEDFLFDDGDSFG